MRQDQHRIYDSLRRAQDFLQGHAGELKGIGDTEGARELNAAVDVMTTHRDQQGSAMRALAGHTSSKRALARRLRTTHMSPIARFARAKLRGVPEFAALTPSVQEKNTSQLIDAGRSMVAAASTHEATLLEAGFPSDTLPRLSQAVDALAEAVAARGTTRAGLVGATKGVDAELRRGRNAIRMLDALITMQFGSDESLMASWNSARRIEAKTGPARSAKQQPVVTSAPIAKAA